MKKRLVSLILAACMVAGMCPAAMAGETEAAAESDAGNPYAGLDLSDYEEIEFYTVGTQGTDWQEVVDQVNDLMVKKINTKVNFHVIPFSDYVTKYQLFLAGDEDIDIIYGAPWIGYSDYVKNGAYQSFDWDFVEKYMPQAAKLQAASSWDEVKVDGKYYSVPNNRSTIDGFGEATTQSLLDKYGYKAEDINSYDKLIEYLDKVAADSAETGVYPINCQNNYPIDAFYWYVPRYHFFDMNAGAITWMVWKYDTGKPFSVDDLQWFASTPEYKDFCLQMADFYKKGYFPSSVMSNDTTLGDNIRAGISAVTDASPGSIASIQADMPDDTVKFLNCCTDDKTQVRRGNYLVYTACFPANSKKMERAAVALDVIKFDPVIHNLLIGGIEGKHYILNKENNTYTPGPDADKYPWYSWAFLYQNDSDPSLELDPELQEIQDQFKAKEAPADEFPVTGFIYDSSKYEAEISALTALMNEYRFSFNFGIYGDDTEAQLDSFISQCKDLGIDDIIADYRQQLSDYLANK